MNDKFSDVKADHYMTYNQIRKHIMNVVPDPATCNSLLTEVDAIINSSRHLGYQQAVHTLVANNPHYTGHSLQQSPCIEEDLEVEFRIEPPQNNPTSREKFIENLHVADEVYWTTGDQPCRVMGFCDPRYNRSESTKVTVRFQDSALLVVSIGSLSPISSERQRMNQREEFMQCLRETNTVYCEKEEKYMTVFGISDSPSDRDENTMVLCEDFDGNTFKLLMEEITHVDDLD
jgi:hypothetical protein